MRKIFLIITLVISFIFIGCNNETFIVSFIGLNDLEISKIEVKNDEKIVYPQPTDIEGYDFVKWDKTIELTDENININAIYERKQFTVTFINGEDIIKEESVYYGEAATSPLNLEKIGFEFIGFDKSFDNIKEDTIINLNYKEITYVISYYDLDNNLLKEEIVKEGKDASTYVPEQIDGYSFIKWDKELTNITANIQTKPIYEKNTYIVSYYGIDNELIAKENVLYLDNAEGIDTALEGYDFVGYSNSLENITSDIDIYLQYTKKQYIVTYVSKESIDSSEEVLIKTDTYYYKDEYIKPELEKEGYTIDSITNEPSIITKDEKIIVVYTFIKYDIKYYDGNNILNIEPNEYNIESFIILPVPSKTGYTFDGWYLDNECTIEMSIIDKGKTGNIIVYSKWIKDEEPFKMPVGAFTMSLKQVKHSTSGALVYQPDLRADSRAPSVSASAYDWSTSDSTIATISTYSTISPAKTGFVIIKATYKNDNSIVGYVLLKVTSNGIVLATEDDVNNKQKFTVRFLDDDGTVLDLQQVEIGKSAVLPPTPKKEGYSFYGWNKSHIEINSNTDIKATYIEEELNLENKLVSIMGDSISTYKDYIPEGFATFYPYSVSHVSDVTQTWWMQLSNKYGMKLLVNDSWSGTLVYNHNGNKSAGETDNRIEKLSKDGIAPDIIIIYMGINDYSYGIETNVFKEAYIRMLNKIEIKYPKARIIVCTLGKDKIASKYIGRTEEYNTVIKNIASSRGYTVFRFDLAFTSETVDNYLCDSVHPNKEGMTKLAEQAIKDMK